MVAKGLVVTCGRVIPPWICLDAWVLGGDDAV